MPTNPTMPYLKKEKSEMLEFFNDLLIYRPNIVDLFKIHGSFMYTQHIK